MVASVQMRSLAVLSGERRTAMTGTSAAAVKDRKGGDSKLHNTLVYMRQHWQLYLLFLMPAFLLTIIFRYIPMGGVLIAFEEYNPFRGILGSQWVGLEHFSRFLKSPDFMRYLTNTLKLSIYGLLRFSWPSCSTAC